MIGYYFINDKYKYVFYDKKINDLKQLEENKYLLDKKKSNNANITIYKKILNLIF